jgi:hypothetical protein
MGCELVCTGWYADDAPRNYRAYGDDVIRGAAFRSLWWQSMDRFVKPAAVLVVDSASPVKSNDRAHTNTRVEYIELLTNPGHSQNCAGHYCGAMAAIILGMEYAVYNDVEFFLYVEQDALIYGDRLIPTIKQMLRTRDLVFGAPGQGGEIEQTVFAVSRRGLRKFLANLHRIGFSDRQISPETKFMYAASKLRHVPLLGLASWDRPFAIRRLANFMIRMLLPMTSEYATLPFGYGRQRPIDFSDDTFYFQQGTAVEIDAYRRKLAQEGVLTDRIFDPYEMAR